MKKTISIFVMALMLLTVVSATMELPEPVHGTRPIKCPKPYSTTYCLYQWISNQDFGSQSVYNTYTTTRSGGLSTTDVAKYLTGNKDMFDRYDTFTAYLDEHYVTKEEFNTLKRQLGEWQGQYYNLVIQVAELQKKV